MAARRGDISVLITLHHLIHINRVPQHDPIPLQPVSPLIVPDIFVADSPFPIRLFELKHNVSRLNAVNVTAKMTVLTRFSP